MIPIKKILLNSLFVVIPLFFGVVFSVYVERGRTTLEGVAATILPEAKALPAFALEDHHGAILDNHRLKERWSFLFFGFTYCPHICPTTLDTLSRVSEKLTVIPNAPQTIFISVDPERDNHERIENYLARFSPDFIGATGSLQDLQTLSASLGIVFDKENTTADESYDVVHSNRIMLIDPSGRLKALFSSPHKEDNIVADYMKITTSS